MLDLFIGLATSQTPLSPLRIEDWNERYQKELGNLRAFLESKTVHPSFFQEVLLQKIHEVKCKCLMQECARTVMV